MAFQAAPTIQTDRLILRAHQLSDYDACCSMWSSPVVTRFIGGTPSSKQETWFRMLRYAGHWSLMGYGYWAIEEKLSKHMIGELGFADFKRDVNPSFQGFPEFGWALRPEFHQKGFATEALKSVLNWTDQEFKWKRTVCMISPENFPSIKLAEKVGYQRYDRLDFSGKDTFLFERTR